MFEDLVSVILEKGRCFFGASLDLKLRGGHKECGFVGYFRYVGSQGETGLLHAYYKCPECADFLKDVDIVSQGCDLEARQSITTYLSEKKNS